MFVALVMYLNSDILTTLTVRHDTYISKCPNTSNYYFITCKSEERLHTYI